MNVRSITSEIAALGPAAAYGTDNLSIENERSAAYTKSKDSGSEQASSITNARAPEKKAMPDYTPLPEFTPKTQLSYAGERTAPAPSMKIDIEALRAFRQETIANNRDLLFAEENAVYRNASPSEVSNFPRRPEYTQFNSDRIATSLTHSFKPDETSVTQTALDGPHRFWSLEKVLTASGDAKEILRDSLGRERYRNEDDGSGWKITETEYQAKSLWRSIVHKKSSDGTYTMRYYSAGREIGSDTQRLTLMRNA